MTAHFARAKTPPPPPPKPRAALRALVPSSYRAEGESHEFLRRYKEKWLSRLDFSSANNVGSLLLLSFMALAEGSAGRAAEAELIADILVKHVDLRRASPAARAYVVAAMFLSSYLKTCRGADAAALVARARALSRYLTTTRRDREWLSAEAPAEVAQALERKNITYLLPPYAGIAEWLNDPAARRRAEEVLAQAQAATRALMVS